jgi:hypothetical protein
MSILHHRKYKVHSKEKINLLFSSYWCSALKDHKYQQFTLSCFKVKCQAHHGCFLVLANQVIIIAETSIFP